MSKRDILAYTKSLVRAGVMERPLWMAAVERCAACRRSLVAACCPLQSSALLSATSASWHQVVSVLDGRVVPAACTPLVARCCRPQDAAAAGGQAGQAAAIHHLPRGRAHRCVLPQAPRGAYVGGCGPLKEAAMLPHTCAACTCAEPPPRPSRHPVLFRRLGWNPSTLRPLSRPPPAALHCVSWS